MKFREFPPRAPGTEIVQREQDRWPLQPKA